MHWSADRPASRQRPQGLWRSQPFLLFLQRWQRGLVERSGWSSSPGARGVCPVDATDCFREGGIEAGDIGPLGTGGSFFPLAPLEGRAVLEDLADGALETEADALGLVEAFGVLPGLLLPVESRDS